MEHRRDGNVINMMWPVDLFMHVCVCLASHVTLRTPTRSLSTIPLATFDFTSAFLSINEGYASTLLVSVYKYMVSYGCRSMEICTAVEFLYLYYLIVDEMIMD
jgi:hypothetical protein